MAETEKVLHEAYPQLKKEIEPNVFFISSQELEDMNPNRSGKEREIAITKEHRTVFIMQIGGKLKSGEKHDGRAPDYDDWTLNGDILMWNDVIGCPLELSSMGIRVDADSLATQLKERNAEDRRKFAYHSGILDGTLPLTIGGGIGQSRICMHLLEKAHIGEVQTAIWPDEMREVCNQHNIELL